MGVIRHPPTYSHTHAPTPISGTEDQRESITAQPIPAHTSSRALAHALTCTLPTSKSNPEKHINTQVPTKYIAHHISLSRIPPNSRPRGYKTKTSKAQLHPFYPQVKFFSNTLLGQTGSIVVTLQETFYEMLMFFSCKGINVLQKGSLIGSDTHAGGIALLIHSKPPFSPISPTVPLHVVAARISIGQTFIVCSTCIYFHSLQYKYILFSLHSNSLAGLE